MTRHSFTARIAAFFKDRPLEWIPATQLEQFGRQAWRTRLSDARLRYRMRIDNRQRRAKKADGSDYTISEYIYRPERLFELTEQGREAHQ